MIASFFRTYIMVSGNTLVTGDFGHHFLKSFDKDTRYRIIDAAMEIVRNELKKEGLTVGANLKKDYLIEDLPSLNKLEGYTSFQVQPNMEMPVRANWNSFDDYGQALKSKSRVRMKRARKKGEGLMRKKLSVDEIEANKEIMYKQYLETVDGAGFNLFHLHSDYNVELKKSLGDDFTVVGYYEDENSLIGYFTLLKNKNALEAHFLGYDHSKNSQYQLYLNFLFDMIEMAIERKVEKIHLSRTAMEIKSSVGAIAIPLKVLMKYNNSLINKILPKALEYFVPEDQWKARNPFKKAT